jgi:predicted NAD/FAD-binding protein
LTLSWRQWPHDIVSRDLPEGDAMSTTWTRRDVLKTIAATATTPVRAYAAQPRPTVAIIGAGMAGISVAWLLDGQRDVVLLESRDSIGGNVRSLDVELDGHRFAVDLGAQFFHPGPYPVYTALLKSLGLFPPAVAAPPPSAAFPASITITHPDEATPRFVSPIIPTRLWPIFTDWNRPGLQAFFTAFSAARAREQNDESWTLTLGDWLPTLGLSRERWEGIILPWAASLFSGDIEQARGMSARAAMLFAAKALPDVLTEQVVYYVLRNGLIEPMRRMLDQCSTVEVITNAAVSAVTRGGSRRFTMQCADGRSFAADDVVFAASGPATLELLQGVPASATERSALRGVEFHHASLALHTDPIYAPVNSAYWSFLNCQRHGTSFCESSMWLANVVTGAPPETAAKLWKSWTTHRPFQPTQVLHQADFTHMLPTPASIQAQANTRRFQGRTGLWFAGGYLFPYDAQETALLSAIEVANGLNGGSTPRGDALLSST